MNAGSPYGSRLDHRVLSCSPYQTLAQVAHQMWRCDARWLPVIDSETVVIGVITEGDIRRAVQEKRARLDDAVSLVMSRVVATVREGYVLGDVERLRNWSLLERFPLVDEDGRLSGVVTLLDHVPDEFIDDESLSARVSGIVSVPPTVRSVRDGGMAA